MNLIPTLLLIAAAVGGFSLAFYIFRTKQKGQKLICPLGSDCDAVVHSEYSQFLGVPVEISGMAYYVLIASGYAALLLFPSLATPVVLLGMLVVTAASFLFALYLTSIQTFVLKQWCTWCLLSTGVGATIFVLALFTFEFRSLPLVDGYEGVACTADAKLCSDGSYVGRIPPNCAFAPCPGQ